MTVQGPKPGRYTPRCGQCQEKFALTIPEDGSPPRIRALAKPATSGTTTAVPGATVAPPRSTVVPQSATVVPPAATVVPPSAMAARPRHSDAAAQAVDSSVARSPSTAGPAARVAASKNAAPDALNVAVTAMRQSGASLEETAPPSISPAAPRAAAAVPAHPDDTSGSLGGYQILRKLGQGGMGAVYLARQLSLDRQVALKVLSPKLADDAGFVSRFTREAYAAAQLVHHNVVQVYDIGEDDGRHFYSMEFVDGESLAGVVARDGRVDPSTAVAYALQAARGLKFAHDRGLIHRDVKPENLMLNTQGVVKVADLGLVKQNGAADIAGGSKLARAQSAEVTGFDLSMGTPAYMAPEQARDAARVDQRADIYSLGCTLYDLLTGRPPFIGNTAVELMTMHASKPVTPPDVLSKRVPKEVSSLLMKMVAKHPDDRYPNAAACIAAMEDFLGAGSSGPFAPKEEHAAELEECVTAFRNTPLARAARYVAQAFFGLMLLAAVIAAMTGQTLVSRVAWPATFLGIGVLTAAAYVVVSGVTRRDVVLGKLRPLLFDTRAGDWVRGILSIGMLGLLVYVFNLTGPVVIVAVIALGLATAFHFGLQWPRDRQRRRQVESIDEMLRTMRLRGLDEDTLRQFVCRYSGTHWEEFYDALFGYDAKLEARRRWGVSLRGASRPRFGRWRDTLIAASDRRIAARRAARARRLLAAVEEAKLEAEGVDLLTARRKAQREANAMVRLAETNRLRPQSVGDARARAAATAAPAPAVVAKQPLDLEPIDRDHESAFARKGGLKQLIFGPGTRFPVALVLLGVFLIWFHQNNPRFPENFGSDAKAVIDGTITDLQRGRDVVLKDTRPHPAAKLTPANDLQLIALPQAMRHQLSGYGVGLAGLLLLTSCFFGNWRAGVCSSLGAAVIVLGSLVIPNVAGFSASLLAAGIGSILVVVGAAVGRES